jgi:hypothetical protein
MVDSGTVVDEEEKVVVCDAFGRGFTTDGSVNFSFEFGKVDIDVECVEGGICGGKTEERSFARTKSGRQ